MPDTFVNVMTDEPFPGRATICGLKLAVTPAGNPETDKASDESNPPITTEVTFSVPFMVAVTVTLSALGVSENPGTFTVTVCVCVTPPPVAVSTTR